MRPGLRCINVAHDLMNLDVQQALFRHALTATAVVDPAKTVLPPRVC